MTITITAFANSPDRGRGLARDMPVRSAISPNGHDGALSASTMAVASRK